MSAVTTAERPPARMTPLVDDVTVAVLAAGTPAGYRTRPLPGGLLALDVTAPAGTALEIRLAVPLGDAVGYWHPGSDWQRTLPADWAGRQATCLVRGAPIGCLYTSSGATTLAFAAEDPVAGTAAVFGVSEKSKRFVVHLELTASAATYTLVFAPSAPSPAAALRELRRHLARVAGATALPVPAAGRRPAYSTWYALGQDLSAAAVEREARLAAELGCGTLILDDGWQRGGRERGYAWAGDWAVDTAKFPDLAGHVAAVRAMGLAYLAWVAPLLVGPDSPVWPELGRRAPLPSPTAPGAHVLDPRDPVARAHVVAVCARLAGDHGLDGLKLDFLDDAAVYLADGGDDDVSAAMELLLGEIRDALARTCPDGPLVELRQPYTGYGMAPYGNLLRANDSPADAVANRVRTVDAGLAAVGGVVHSDMLMWDPDGAPESAVRQLLAVLHAVPQLSCRLSELRPDHREALAFWLAQWTRLRPVLLDGELEPGRPDELFPLVRATAGDAAVSVVHAERIVPLDLRRTRAADVVNATAAGTLLLLVTGGPVEVAEVAHDACGRVVRSGRRTWADGPVAVGVPPSGLLSLRVGG